MIDEFCRERKVMDTVFRERKLYLSIIFVLGRGLDFTYRVF